LIKLINRLLIQDSGDIFVGGKNISDFQQDALRRNMGYAIQGVGLFPHMKVSDNIAIVPNLLKWPKEKISRRVDELLELVGLPVSYRNKYPSQMSGGEAQRVGVARALAADPDILLMDEPFGALDPINRVRLQQEFLKIQKQLHKTVVFVTHDVGEAVRMADQLVILQEGKIIAHGNPFSIVNEAEAVAKAFLGDSYTLELLEKHTLGMYQHLLKKVASNDVIRELNEISTFKEVLSKMLIQGKSQLIVRLDYQNYEIDFETMLNVFEGQSL
jgi:osmoprotectant transport system ATP-binding protein